MDLANEDIPVSVCYVSVWGSRMHKGRYNKHMTLKELLPIVAGSKEFKDLGALSELHMPYRKRDGMLYVVMEKMDQNKTLEECRGWNDTLILSTRSVY